MAQTHNDLPSRACKCLNVRIWPQRHPDEKPPDFLMPTAADSDYALTCVGEQGIFITHPQVTMRTRKIGPPTADLSRCIRFTTLTCLLCQTAAYRVQQLVAPDVDLQEGPLLPSLDWVEQETLLSSSGWVQVHKDCLLAEDVKQLSSSPTYSPVFGIALPQSAMSIPTSSQTADESPKEPRPQTSTPVGPYLYSLKPLFPPAPFVPSHPVFSHLSSIAVKVSEQLRSLAEDQIAAIIRDKLEELEKVNDGFRHNVEELWRKFVENMGEVETQMGPRATKTRGRDSSRGLSSPTTGVSGAPLVSIRNFVPNGSAAPRTFSPSSSLPRVSSLSASLATSGFHHIHMVQAPTEARERSSSNSFRSPPPYSSHPSSLGSAESPISSSLGSSAELSPPANGENITQPFKRSMDEARDTAASFRYFTILEADVARARQVTSQPNTRSQDASPKAGEPAKEIRDLSAPKGTTPAETKETSTHPPESSDRDVKSPTTRRRKVKFDIKAEAVKEASSVNRASRDQEEPMIFDFEDGTSELALQSKTELIFELEDGTSDLVLQPKDNDEPAADILNRYALAHAGFPTSLPIDISPLSRRREPLSLASYQPQTSLSNRAGTIVPTFPDARRTRASSTTFRKASYAERDRSRAIDPGTLDFIAGEEAEEDQSDEEPSHTNEARGRQRALKILEARSKIPEAGMWMSLA